MNPVDYYFDNTLSKDLLSLVAGKQLGSGQYRHVFECLLDRSCVIKFELGAQSFSNVHEWDVWDRIKDTTHAKWFAPCVSISACGSILVQRRTIPLREKELPAQIPAFFTDIKRSNWGLLDGRPVCHDYGINLLMEQGMTKRLRKADWSYE